MNRRIFAAGSVALLMIVAVVTLFSVFTAQVSAIGNMYISPANATVVRGNNVTVSLFINPSTPVTVVEGTVNFDPSKLQYVSMTSGGSPFDASVQQTVSSNNIRVVRAKLDSAGVNTNALVASITFRALSYSGTSSISLTAQNAAFNGSYTNPSAAGSTITFNPGSCPAGQVGTPPSCTTPPPTTPTNPTTPTTPRPSNPSTPRSSTPSTPNTPSNPSNPSTPTPSNPEAPTDQPQGSGLGVPNVTGEEVQYTKLSVNVTTNTAARTQLVYGVAADALNLQSAQSENGTEHSLAINEGLAPGSELFYKVVATDGTTTKESEVRSVYLKGLTMKVALFDKAMKPLANQKVVVQPSGKEFTSDGNGFVVLTGLAPGDYTIEIKDGDLTHAQYLAVQSNIEEVAGVQTSAERSDALVFDGYTAPEPLVPVWAWYVGGGGLALLILAGLAVWSWRKNGIVRTIYTKIRGAAVNQKMNSEGITAGSFGPTVGAISSADTQFGSNTAPKAETGEFKPFEPVAPAPVEPFPTETPQITQEPSEPPVFGEPTVPPVEPPVDPTSNDGAPRNG